MFLHYLKITFRNMVKNSGRYIFIVSGIAVGIVIFSLVFFFMFEARGKGIEYFAGHARMVEIGYFDSGSDRDFSYGIGRDLLQRVEELDIADIEKISTFKPFGWDNHVNDASDETSPFLPYAANLLVVNSGFFDLLGLKFISGSQGDWQDNQAVIQSSFAKKVFGNSYPVGKTIDVWEGIDTKLTSYTVVGVIQDVPVDAFNAGVYVASFERVAARPSRAIALLKKNADIDRLNAQLATLQIPKPNGESFVYPQLKKVSDPQKTFSFSVSLTQFAILLIAILILLSALINYINLLAESVVSRIRQFTLRRIVGAGKGSLFLLLLCDVIPVLLISLLLAYALSEILLQLLSQGVLPNYPDLWMHIPRFNRIPLTVIGGVFIFSVLLLMFFVYRLRNIVTVEGIRGQLSKVSKKRMRNSSLIIQLLFTFFLLSGIFTIIPFMNRAAVFPYKSLPKEAQPEAVFAVPLTTLTLPQHQEDILRDIQKIPGVEDVLQMGTFMGFGEAIETDIPAYSNMLAGQMLPDSTGLPYEIVMGGDNLISFLYVDENTPVIKRELADDEVVISQQLADKLKDYPEVQVIDIMGAPYKIAGIVPHIGFAFYTEYGTVWLPLRHAPVSGLYVKCSSASKNQIRREILSVIRNYLPESIPYEVESLSQIFERKAGYPKTIARIAYLIAFFALVIILFGIYTAVLTDTAKSRKSVAIRKINGATRTDIYQLFGRSYVILITIAFIISAPLIVFVFDKIFMSIPVEFRPDNWHGLLWALVCITVFVMLVVHRKIKDIAKTNPAEGIQSE